MPATLKARRPRVSKAPQVVEVPDLTGGLNLRVSPTLLQSDESQQLRNWAVDEPGALTVRPGYTRFTAASLGSNRPQGGHRVYLSSHTFTLVAYGQQVYDVSDGGAFSSVLSGLSTNEVHFVHDRDLVVPLDGTTNRIKTSTDGTAWQNFGIETPGTAPTASTLSSGVCSSGQYEFAYSYKDRSLSYESNISDASTVTLSGSTGAFHLTATASTEAHVDAYVWYGRDITAGETVLRRISSGAASTFRVTDTNWTANQEAPTNHDVLTSGRFGVVWKNRWWIADAEVTNRLRFSELFLPQAFPALFYIDIPFEQGDSITALVPLGDILVVWGQSKAYIVFGQTSLDFEVRPSAGTIAGALGQRATCVVEQGIVHASAEGVYIFDSATDRLLSHDVQKAWRHVMTASPSELAKLAMVYEFRRKCVRIAVPKEYPYGTSGEMELNLDRSGQDGGRLSWVTTDRNVGGYISFDGAESQAGNRGELLTWSDTAGILFKESTGTTANSSNMVAYYTGPALALGLHRAMVTGLHVEYEPHGGALTTETVIDNVSQGLISLSIGSGIAQWGSAIWGTFTWGGAGRRKAYTEQPLAAEGRTVTLKVTYSGQEAARIFTYAYDIVPETKMSFLSE